MRANHDIQCGNVILLTFVSRVRVQ
jgi:hypothetical protein